MAWTGLELGRREFLVGSVLATTGLVSRPALAAQTIRVALPTKTYWPTIVAEAAKAERLFEKEGLTPELTVYRGGAEAFEALAAGAADIVLDPPALVAAGRKRGVMAKIVAGATTAYNGWYLMVAKDSKFEKVSDLAGKKVGITSTGSASDLLATWTIADSKVAFTKVPLGGGGLVPNLISGNIDATVLYSPLTFQVMRTKEARSIVDFGAEVPEHSTGSWIASDKMIKEKPEALQKALNALYGGVAFLRAPENRGTAVKLIAEIDEIPDEIAEAELDGNIVKLSTTGEFRPEWMERAMEMAKLIGMTDLAPVADAYVTQFRPVPTKA
jgi:NitT/TauT family transport system substrate-binding protein